MKTNHALLVASTAKRMQDILFQEDLRLQGLMKKTLMVNVSSVIDSSMAINTSMEKLLIGYTEKELPTSYFKGLKCFVSVQPQTMSILLRNINKRLMLLAKVAIHDKYFRDKARTLAGVDGDDLVQEMYLKLYRYNQSKLKEMIQNGVVRYLGVRIINQIFIDGKRKQKEYCGGVPEIKVEEKEQDERITKAKEIIKDQHWYDQEIFRLYIEENYTMRGLAAETGIPLCEIWATINRVKKKVKQEL